MTNQRIISVNFDSPDPNAINQAIDILNGGGLVVAPTETLYGLLGRADKAEVVEKVYRVKGRPLSQATAVFLRNLDTVASYGELNPAAKCLAELFLPGPLTLIMKALAGQDTPVTCEGKIGIRISKSPVIMAIVEKVTYPLTATSANVSGSVEPYTVDDISLALGAGVDLYLDSGELIGAPSTVVDCTDDSPRILRKGAIDEIDIMMALRSLTT